MAQLAMLGGVTGGGVMSLMLPMFSSVIGMFMQPGQKDEQGKLNDLKVSTSAYGQGIALVYGTMRVPGNMFWATEFEEKKRYISSKGKDITGKKKDDKKGQPVYEYYANFAMGLCEGPVGEVLRIWADSNLIYDKLNPDNPDIVEIGFSVSENNDSGGKMGFGSATGKKGGNQDSGRFRFRFHDGSEHQMPDPHMVAKNKASGDTPTSAHRGLAYLYFERFALMDFGNRIPTITAEVTRRHLRKPVFTPYQSLEKQGLPTHGVSPGTSFSQLFFDPVRFRAYTVGGGILRQWDLFSRKEVKRTRVSDITGKKVPQVRHPSYRSNGPYYQGESTLFNGVAGVNYPTSMQDMVCGRIVGIAASGDLIGAAGGMNTHPIVFIDPESLTIKTRFGTFGNNLSNGSTSIAYSEHSTLLGSQDAITGSSGLYTAIVSMFGSFYFFDDKNSPMNYWDLGGSIFGDRGLLLAPGVGATGASFFTTQGSVLFQQEIGQVVRYEAYIMPRATDPMDVTLGEVTPPTSLNGTPYKRTVLYETAPEDDESGRSLTTVYPVIGAEAVGFLEFISGNTINPEKNGTYAVKVGVALNREGKFDVLWRQKISDGTSFNPTNNANKDSVILTGNRLVMRVDQTTVWDIDFASEKVDMWYLPADAPPFSRTQIYVPARGSLISEWNNAPAALGGTVQPILVEAALDRMVQHKITPAEILLDLADKVGIERHQMDTSRLKDDEITGYVMQQPKSARHVADDLMKVFFFDIAESDYMLKAVSRESATLAVTVPERDLGYIDGGTAGDNVADFYKETRTQEIDLPQTVMVTYIDPKDDYETGEQHWRRPRSPLPVMQSRETLDLNIPMAMEADFAKQMAQKIIYSAWSERSQFELALPWKYMKYDPTDILAVQMDNGLRFQTRISSLDLGQDFSIRLSGVATEMASYTSSVKSQGNGRIIQGTRVLPPFVRAEIFDLPYFEDSDSVGDSGFLYHWAFKAYGPGFGIGGMSRKTLPHGAWEGLGMLPYDVVWGTVIGLVAPPPWGSAWPTDDRTEITLQPAFDFTKNDGMYEWESIPDEEWPSSRNAIVIAGEIIYFKNLRMNSDGTITIYNLLRGARGTINESYAHLPAETWVIVGPAMKAELESFETVGQRVVFRPSAPTIMPGGLPLTEKKFVGASHKPWAPNMIKRAVSGANLVFTWARSSRLGGQLKPSTGTVPQIEGPESYEAYVLLNPYDPSIFDPDDPTTFKRAFGPLTTPTFTYTQAQMTTDGVNQNSTLHIVVLQRNQFVGRGFPGWHTSFPGA
jgi:hypothetical protein